MLKIAIFGSNGMLGTYICKVFNKYYKIKKIDRTIFDLEKNNWNEIEDLIRNEDIIINCIGIIPQRNCTDIKKYFLINSMFPHYINNICKKNKKRLIHITTDCVYNGNKGFYKIEDKHDSDSIYGISKSLGEPIDCMVIRTSIIGEEIYNKKSLLEWVLNSNSEINGYVNHLWNGITCLELTKILNKLIKNNLFWLGTKIITSPDIISKYELCKYIIKLYNKNIFIKPVYHKNNKNMTMKANINICKKNIRDQIKELYIFNIKSISPAVI